MTIRNFAIAQALYVKYCREHNPQALSEIYIQEDDFNSQAELFLMESFDPTVSCSASAVNDHATQIALSRSRIIKQRNEIICG